MLKRPTLRRVGRFSLNVVRRDGRQLHRPQRVAAFVEERIARSVDRHYRERLRGGGNGCVLRRLILATGGRRRRTVVLRFLHRHDTVVLVRADRRRRGGGRVGVDHGGRAPAGEVAVVARPAHHQGVADPTGEGVVAVATDQGRGRVGAAHNGDDLVEVVAVVT